MFGPKIVKYMTACPHTGEMAKHKYGCAVVMERGEVLGLFTTTDALQVLHDLLAERHPRREPLPRPRAR
jgi:hypothetical protein